MAEDHSLATQSGQSQTLFDPSSTPPPQVYGEVKISLENCIIPHDRLLKTPSSDDGIDSFLEFSLRRYGCDLIQLAGHLLKLPQVAMATAQVLYQRFFYSRSFLKHHYQRVAMACILLSSKVEEAPRRPRDVINTFHHVKQVCFFHEAPTPVVLDAEYIRTKTDVIKCERRLLKELGFCVHVQHPHKLIFMYVKMLLAGTVLEIKTNDVNPFLQNAWNYMNDSLRTDLFARYSPEHIACACISLALRDQDEVALPQQPRHWAEAFGCPRVELERMCREIRALYEIKPPSMKEVDDSIEVARSAYEKRRKEQFVSAALANVQAKVNGMMINKNSPLIATSASSNAGLNSVQQASAMSTIAIPPSTTVAAAMSTTIAAHRSPVLPKSSKSSNKRRSNDDVSLNDRDRHGNVRSSRVRDDAVSTNDAERSRDRSLRRDSRERREKPVDSNIRRSRSRNNRDETRNHRSSPRSKHHRSHRHRDSRAEKKDEDDDRDERRESHSRHRHTKHRHKSHRHRNEDDSDAGDRESGKKPTESSEDRQRQLAALAAKVISASRAREARRVPDNESVSS